MEAFKTAGYILLGLLLLLVVLFALIKVIVWFYDQQAIKLAKEYCKQRNYNFKRVALHPNLYGLHFSNLSGHFYATYYIGPENKIIWIRGLPEDIIKARINEGSFHQSHPKKNNTDNTLKSVG